MISSNAFRRFLFGHYYFDNRLLSQLRGQFLYSHADIRPTIHDQLSHTRRIEAALRVAWFTLYPSRGAHAIG